MIIAPEFFARPSPEVAPELLGHYLCRRFEDGRVMRGVITETEAYEPGDPACHGYRRKTPRNAAMWAKPGTIYVYISYGIHHCMNVACTADEVASALLIRALQFDKEDIRVAAGPAKLCKFLDIDLKQNGQYANGQQDIWFEESPNFKKEPIVETTRIGLTRGVDIPWRWYIKDDKSVSKFATKKAVQKVK